MKRDPSAEIQTPSSQPGMMAESVFSHKYVPRKQFVIYKLFFFNCPIKEGLKTPFKLTVSELLIGRVNIASSKPMPMHQYHNQQVKLFIIC